MACALQATGDSVSSNGSAAKDQSGSVAADDADAAAASATERRRCPSCGGRLGMKLRCALLTHRLWLHGSAY